MKLKRTAEDFQVDEQVALLPAGGTFALYRLTKQSLGTLEALDAIARRWNLPAAAIAFAGLKDRHALTRQHLTIREGPRRGLTQTNFELEYLGQALRPVHAKDITGNRFLVTMRDLSADDCTAMAAKLNVLDRDGLPNYFDNQRFGSLGISGQFIAQPWCLGDYERAVWLAIADDNVHDRPEEREVKKLLRDHWGDWQMCRGLLSRSQQQSVISHLAAHPRDFRRAIALLRQDLRSLWLAAFQSHLWNQILAEQIRRVCRSQALVAQAIGGRELPFFTELNGSERQALANAVLPLPSARLHLEPGPLKQLIDDVLAREGLELRQVRVKYPRDSFFSKGERPAIFHPAELSHRTEADDVYPGRHKLTLQFTLARGSYATILIKQLTGVDPGDEDESSET
jgi:tRNA pseudouridine13 synthase